MAGLFDWLKGSSSEVPSAEPSRDPDAFLQFPAKSTPLSYKDGTFFATERNNKSTDKIEQSVVQRITREAQNQGVDPYYALAIALQETNLGSAGGAGYSTNPMFMNIYPRNEDNTGYTRGADGIADATIHLKNLLKKTGGDEMESARLYHGKGVAKAHYQSSPGVWKLGTVNAKIPYNQKVAAYKDDIMKNPDIVQAINSAYQK